MDNAEMWGAFPVISTSPAQGVVMYQSNCAPDQQRFDPMARAPIRACAGVECSSFGTYLLAERTAKSFSERCADSGLPYIEPHTEGGAGQQPSLYTASAYLHQP
jgi:hypothetical protein